MWSYLDSNTVNKLRHGCLYTLISACFIIQVIMSFLHKLQTKKLIFVGLTPRFSWVWVLITCLIKEHRAPSTHSVQLLPPDWIITCAPVCLDPTEIPQGNLQESIRAFSKYAHSKFGLAFASSLHIIFFFYSPRSQLA